MKGMRIATTGVEHLGLGDDENDDVDLLDCGDDADNGEDVTDDESQMIVTNVDHLDCGDDEQGCISCGLCSYPELTEDHVLPSA